MSEIETILYFVVAPLVIYAVVAIFIYAPRAARQSRYRPGRPWDYAPVWYSASAPPSHGPGSVSNAGSAPMLGSSRAQPALPAAADEPSDPAQTARGGARGTW